jgi:hypothetical protein
LIVDISYHALKSQSPPPRNKDLCLGRELAIGVSGDSAKISVRQKGATQPSGKLSQHARTAVM